MNYKGYDVWEIPPNGQGITALMALNILNEFDFTERECARSYHLQIEAMKLAFAESLAEVADPRYMRRSVEELLSGEFAKRRAALIDAERAGLPTSERQSSGGTVYLAAADGEGNMISMIQSNYQGFGSGLCVPGTGVTLHNRGNNFSLDPESPNCLAPRKKPYHTIIPGFITRGGEPVGPFGVMGAFMQPQGHVQMAVNMIDFALNPQESLDEGPAKRQGHSPEVEKQKNVSVCLDKVQYGLACVNSWGALPLPEYRIPYADYTFRLKIAPATRL